MWAFRVFGVEKGIWSRVLLLERRGGGSKRELEVPACLNNRLKRRLCFVEFDFGGGGKE